MEFRGKRGQGLGKGLWGEVCVWWGEVGHFSLTSVDATALFLLFLYIYIYFLNFQKLSFHFSFFFWAMKNNKE